MATEHESPEVMSSRSELEVSDPARRNDILAVLRGVLADLATDHRSPVEGSAHEADFDGATIILHLRISGVFFVRADQATQHVIGTLVERIDGCSWTGWGAAPPAVRQMSQTLVPD